MSPNPVLCNPLVDRWLPIQSRTRNAPDERSPAGLLAVVRDLLRNFGSRYDPTVVRNSDGTGHTQTYCNIFVWDCTQSLGCEVPHWIDEETGVACAVGRGREVSANGIFRWLDDNGRLQGWRLITAAEARLAADAGRPTFAHWTNPHGPGHVALLLPSSPDRPQRIAQAGVRVGEMDLDEGFGTRVPELTYWVHE